MGKLSLPTLLLLLLPNSSPAASKEEIAEQLGFSDESAFAKAFRRWTGKSPSQFRESV